MLSSRHHLFNTQLHKWPVCPVVTHNNKEDPASVLFILPRPHFSSHIYNPSPSSAGFQSALLLHAHTFEANRGDDGCKFHSVKCKACVCIAVVVMSDFSCRGALKETPTFQQQNTSGHTLYLHTHETPMLLDMRILFSCSCLKFQHRYTLD